MRPHGNGHVPELFYANLGRAISKGQSKYLAAPTHPIILQPTKIIDGDKPETLDLTALPSRMLHCRWQYSAAISRIRDTRSGIQAPSIVKPSSGKRHDELCIVALTSVIVARNNE